METGPILYTILLVIGFICLVLAYRKSKSKKILLLFFAVVGLTLLFDYIIYVWFKAYKYDPDILKGKYDSHIGALINAMILPAAAMLFAILQGRWFWSVLLAALFSGIEILFTKVGIFKPKWWEWIYTFFILIFYFPIIRAWWNRLKRPYGMALSFSMLVSIVYSIRIPLEVVIYGILKTRTYHLKWLEKLNIDGSAINSVVTLLFGVACAYLVLYHARKIWFVVVLIGFSIIDQIMKSWGMIEVHEPDWLLYAVSNLIPMILGIYFGKMMKKSNSR